MSSDFSAVYAFIVHVKQLLWLSGDERERDMKTARTTTCITIAAGSQVVVVFGTEIAVLVPCWRLRACLSVLGPVSAVRFGRLWE